MRHFSRPLEDIPWARTGLPFPQTQGKPDRLGKLHDSYRQIINDELFDTLKKMVLSSEVSSLGLFNMDALESLLNVNRLIPHANRTWLDDKLLWIASLHELVKLYQVQGVHQKEQTIGARFAGKVGAPMKLLTEKAVNRVKKFYILSHRKKDR
jgi:hypothetical protein